MGVTYTTGSLLGLAVGFLLLARTIGMPALRVDRAGWRKLASDSIPFAAQDVFTVLLFKIDAVILSLIATQAAVGAYGAAYRLFESTLFVGYALTGAFAAMYTYLGSDTIPTLRAVFQRSIKLAVIALVPISVAFMTLAAPIVRAVYGPGFAATVTPLRILGPTVTLIGVVNLATSLMVSRQHPRRMISLTALMTALNIAVNLVLIPLYQGTGAAIAMIVTYAVYFVWIMRLATQEAGGFTWVATVAASTGAAGAMALATLLVGGNLAIVLGVGALAYLAVLVALERVFSPLDLVYVADLVRRRRRTTVAG
jgi:O-antigen/teichoic acid export membrane protein